MTRQHLSGRVEAGGVLLVLLVDPGRGVSGGYQPNHAALTALRGQRLHLPLEGHRLLPVAVQGHPKKVGCQLRLRS